MSWSAEQSRWVRSRSSGGAGPALAGQGVLSDLIAVGRAL